MNRETGDGESLIGRRLTIRKPKRGEAPRYATMLHEGRAVVLTYVYDPKLQDSMPDGYAAYEVMETCRSMRGAQDYIRMLERDERESVDRIIVFR